MNLFVYGTLAPGKKNEHILSELSGSWMKGCVRGELHDSGWGAALGCPGIILNARGKDVQGLLFSSPELAGFWSTLDKFEGKGYRRTLTTVLLENGKTVNAYIYELAKL